MIAGERILVIEPDAQRAEACSAILGFLGIEAVVATPSTLISVSGLSAAIHASGEDSAALESGVRELRKRSPTFP